MSQELEAARLNSSRSPSLLEVARQSAQCSAPTSTNESILQEAERLVHGNRGADYGHPHHDYAATVAIWRALIQRRYGVDVPLTPDFGCLMMVAVKLSREAGKPKRDNRVDGAGYLECADMCLNFEETK